MIFIEIFKLIIELIIIIFISKSLLVPILRRIGENLNLKPTTIGNISGIATSIPEFLTVTFSAITGMTDAGIFNILSSNIINFLQYIISVFINQNLSLLKNRAIKINLFMVLITIILPVIIWKLNFESNIFLIPIFLILFVVFNRINKYNNSEFKLEKEEILKRHNSIKSTVLYIVYILLIGFILYILGVCLSGTLENLCYTFNISEIIIGFILGIATSIPEFITFIESQRHHKENNKYGIIEASNNLLTSNTINLFIIQSISIFILFLE